MLATRPILPPEAWLQLECTLDLELVEVEELADVSLCRDEAVVSIGVGGVGESLRRDSLEPEMSTLNVFFIALDAKRLILRSLRGLCVPLAVSASGPMGAVAEEATWTGGYQRWRCS